MLKQLQSWLRPTRWRFLAVGTAGLAGLFTAYLLYRRMQLSFWPLAGAAVLLWGTFLLPLWAYFKNVHCAPLAAHKRRAVLAAGLALVIGVCGLDLFLYSYRPTDVVVEALPQTDARSSGSFVRLDRAVADHQNWRAEENATLFEQGLSEGDKPQTLRFERAATIQLSFQTGPDAGVLRLQDGGRVVTQNLYSLYSGQYYYRVQSGWWLNRGSPATYIRGLAAFALLFLLCYAALKAVWLEYTQRKSFFVLAMVVIFVLSLAYYSHFDGIITHSDSNDYYLHNFEQPGLIKPQVFVYPLFLAVLRAIFGNGACFMQAVLAAQALLSFASAAVFYKALRLLCPYKALCAAATVLYAANPAVLTWNLCYLTESLSLSGTVLCLYFTLACICRPAVKTALAAVGTALVLVFLRPSFLLLLGLLLGFFIGRLIFERQTKTVNLSGLLASLVAFALVGVYALLFSLQYGYFSISTTPPYQTLFVCIHEGFYRESDDEVFVQRVETALDEAPPGDMFWPVEHIRAQYSGGEILKLTAACRNNAGLAYWNYIMRAMVNNAAQPYPNYILAQIARPVVFNQLLNVVYYGHVYLLALLELAAAIATWVLRRRPQWVHLGLFAYMALIIIASFTATNGEFIRIGVSVLPFAYTSLLLGVSALVYRACAQWNTGSKISSPHQAAGGDA